MIREYLERRRFKRVLAKFIDPESVKAMLRGDGEGQKIKAGRIEFVLAFVRGDNPTQISERMARVADIALKSGATVYHLVAGLVIAAFDKHPSSPTQPDRRASLFRPCACSWLTPSRSCMERQMAITDCLAARHRFCLTLSLCLSLTAYSAH